MNGVEGLNPSARIIAEEALRRGVHVEVTDGGWGEMRLSHGGRIRLQVRRTANLHLQTDLTLRDRDSHRSGPPTELPSGAVQPTPVEPTDVDRRGARS